MTQIVAGVLRVSTEVYEALDAAQKVKHRLGVGDIAAPSRGVFMIATPWILLCGGNARLCRVIVNVLHAAEQLAVVFDGDASKPILEDGAPMSGDVVEVARVYLRHCVHHRAEVILRVIKQQMHVVLHKAPRDDMYAALRRIPLKEHEELRSIRITLKQEPSPVTSVRDVVETGF